MAATQPELTEEAKQGVIEIVRSRLTPDQSAGLTDQDIRRFCYARSYVPDEVYTMLTEYLKWRAEARPEDIGPNDPRVKKEASTGKAYFLGYTKERLPLILVHGGGHDPVWSPLSDTKAYALYMLETAIKHMPPDVTKFCLISDYSTFSVIDNMDNDLLKEGARMLQAYFPERLGDIYLTNYSSIMSGIWSIVSYWVDERTRAKFHFVSDLQEILDLADASIIPTFLGGELEDHMPTDGNSGIERLQKKLGFPA